MSYYRVLRETLHITIIESHRSAFVRFPSNIIYLPLAIVMTSSSTPIHPHRFAEAIQELPLSNLHLKAAELRNSVAHLHSSNQELQPFADEGDRDCAEAIRENAEVIERMEERIILLRLEVERRGYPWSDEEPVNANGEVDGDTEVDRRYVHRNTHGPVHGLESSRPHGGQNGG